MAAADGVRLFVGGNAGNLRGQPIILHGDRCFSAARASRGPSDRLEASRVVGLLDSGAFSDPPQDRLSPEAALERQLLFERKASRRWGGPWQALALVSYDWLIDEKWYGVRRVKQRWSVAEAEWAVEQTIAAAHYLASQRAQLAPRRLVLACQGVDAAQYVRCVTGVLAVAQPGDWVGLGGWCILGQQPRRWADVFWRTLWRVLPQVAAAGVRHVHLFGVLYLPAVAGLLWLADQHGLTVSVDSAMPIVAATRADARKAGMRGETWQANVAYWQTTLRDLRRSPRYCQPPRPGEPWQQLPFPGLESAEAAQRQQGGDQVLAGLDRHTQRALPGGERPVEQQWSSSGAREEEYDGNAETRDGRESGAGDYADPPAR